MNLLKLNNKNLIRDLSLVFLSVMIAIVISKTGALQGILSSTKEFRIISSFFSGIFFVFIFTTAPAIAVLKDLAQNDSIFVVAFFGGLGAVVGDVIIFRFIKNNLTGHILEAFHKMRAKWLPSSPKQRMARISLAMLGAIVIASPFPDEIGLMLLGLSEIRMRIFIILAFALNFLGILAMGAIFKNI